MSLSIEIVDRLKHVLRTKSISYRNLAEGLGMSEAAIKRAFSERAFSLIRLEQICSYLSLSTRDLLTADPAEEPLSRVLNEAQELLLASDEKLMCFFYIIAAGASLDKVKAIYKFSDTEIDRYLLALDKIKLIRLNPQNKFKVLVDQNFYWQKNGVLSEYYEQEIRRDFVKHDFNGPKDGEGFTAGFLSDSSFETLRKRMQALEDDIREMMRLDGKYRDRKMTNVTWYYAYRPWSMPMMLKYRRTPK